MAQAASVNKCPVCCEEYKAPKVLLCTHLVCQQCLLSALKVDSEKPVGCPCCQHPILPPQEEGPIDLPDFIENLPTDFATQFKIDNQKVLSSGGVCAICESDSGTDFCIQCQMKLCSMCLKHHCKIPSCSDHSIESLTTLTEEQLAARKSLPCSVHKERSLEMYCLDHCEPVCGSCAASLHRKCERVEDLAAVAETERKHLEEQKQRLKQRETSLAAEIENLNQQIAEAEEKFALMKERVISSYVDIMKTCENQKHQALDAICEKEHFYLDEKVSNKGQLEALRSAIAAHGVVIDTLISSNSHMALLATLHKLKSRLDNLETKKALPDDSDKVKMGDLHINDEVVDKLKEMSGMVAELKDLPHDRVRGRRARCHNCDTANVMRKTEDRNGLVRCLDCDSVIEGTFQFVTEFRYDNVEQTSAPCIIRDIPWRISVQARFQGLHWVHGLYLWCDLPENVTSCNVKAELKLLSVQPGGNLRQIEVKHKFQKTERKGQEIDFDWLYFSYYQYIKDGKVTVVAHVVADAPEVTK